ncbi:oxidoreductase [Nonomuraea soli]
MIVVFGCVKEWPGADNRIMRRLTKAERQLWRAFPSGGTVQLGPILPRMDGAGTSAPDDGHLWGPERTVRAEVVAALLLGAVEADPGRVPALRLRGARVVGVLDLRGGEVKHEVELKGCHLDEVVQMSGCTSRTIRLVDCHLPGVMASGLRVSGHLSLSGSHVTGAVRMARATFESGLWLAGTRIDGDGTWALYAHSMVVDSGLLMRNAHFTGATSLVGARANNGIELDGTTLVNPGKDAFTGDNMIVEDIMRFGVGFTAHGCVRLRGSRFNGTLMMAGKVTSPDTEYALHLGGIEARELWLGPEEPIDGVITLGHSRVGTFFDDHRVWSSKIRLNGLTYERLRGGNMRGRIGWVGRDPEGFRPQPYEQLAAWYIRDGNEVLARRAQLAKARAWRRHRSGPGGRFFGALLDMTVGYGYRPWLATIWFGSLLAVGTAIFWTNPPRAVKPDESPIFEPFAYTFDLLLPVSLFGQRDMFDPAGWTQGFAYGLIIMGWVLVTALIAGATRVLRPG